MLPMTAATMIPGRMPWLCARMAAGVEAGVAEGEVRVRVVVLVYEREAWAVMASGRRGVVDVADVSEVDVGEVGLDSSCRVVVADVEAGEGLGCDSEGEGRCELGVAGITEGVLGKLGDAAAVAGAVALSTGAVADVSCRRTRVA